MAGRWEGSVKSTFTVIVNAVVLVMQGTMKDPTPERFTREHSLHEWFELNVTVIESCRERTSELQLIGLETRYCQCRP